MSSFCSFWMSELLLALKPTTSRSLKLVKAWRCAWRSSRHLERRPKCTADILITQTFWLARWEYNTCLHSEQNLVWILRPGRRQRAYSCRTNDSFHTLVFMSIRDLWRNSCTEIDITRRELVKYLYFLNRQTVHFGSCVGDDPRSWLIFYLSSLFLLLCKTLLIFSAFLVIIHR